MVFQEIIDYKDLEFREVQKISPGSHRHPGDSNHGSGGVPWKEGAHVLQMKTEIMEKGRRGKGRGESRQVQTAGVDEGPERTPVSLTAAGMGGQSETAHGMGREVGRLQEAYMVRQKHTQTGGGAGGGGRGSGLGALGPVEGRSLPTFGSGDGHGLVAARLREWRDPCSWPQCPQEGTRSRFRR